MSCFRLDYQREIKTQLCYEMHISIHEYITNKKSKPYLNAFIVDLELRFFDEWDGGDGEWVHTDLRMEYIFHSFIPPQNTNYGDKLTI